MSASPLEDIVLLLLPLPLLSACHREVAPVGVVVLGRLGQLAYQVHQAAADMALHGCSPQLEVSTAAAASMSWRAALRPPAVAAAGTASKH